MEVTWLGRRGSLCFGVALGAVAASAVASPAAAQDEEEPIQLAYSASAACPDEAAFVARVQARTGRARFGSPGAGAREFDVALVNGPPSSGALTVRGPDGRAGTRRVLADTCAGAADALALIVALVIDPQAIQDREPPARPSPPPTPPSTDAKTGGTEAPSVAPAPEQPEAVAPLPPVVPARVDRSGAAPRATGNVLFAGADLVVSQGVAPNALVAVAPYVGWRGRFLNGLEPSARAAFVRAGSGAVDVPPGTTVFTWTVVRVDACPVDRHGRAFSLTACARLEAGALDVEGGVIDSARTAHRAWFAAGPLLRAEWAFLDPLFVEAEASALLRATDDHFFFLPDIEVYRVPVVGFGGGVGIGAHVP